MFCKTYLAEGRVKDRLIKKVWIAKQIKNNKVRGWSVPLIISGLPVVTVSGEQTELSRWLHLV